MIVEHLHDAKTSVYMLLECVYGIKIHFVKAFF